MDKTTYRGLTTEERIGFLNSEMTAGKKLSLACKEIGIADNVTTAFRAKGYIRNEQGLFVKHEPQHPGQMSIEQVAATTDAEDVAITEEGDIIPIADLEAIENEGLMEENVHSNAKVKKNSPMIASTMAQEPTESKEVTIMPTNETKPVEEETNKDDRHPNDISHLYDQPLGHSLDTILRADGVITTPESETTGGAHGPYNISEPKKAGRPARSSQHPIKKLTIEIDQEVYKALMHYKVDQVSEKLYVNEFIERLIKENVPEKYFKSL